MTLDWVLGAVIAGFAIMGFWRGLLQSMVGMVALGVGYWVAYHHAATLWQYVPLTEGLGGNAAWGVVGCFLVVYAVMLAAGSMLSRMVSWAGLGILNRVLGAGLGVLKGVILVWCLLMPLRWVIPDQVATATIPKWMGSQWATYEWMAAYLPPFKDFNTP